jgi:hypothetical protein
MSMPFSLSRLKTARSVRFANYMSEASFDVRVRALITCIQGDCQATLSR